MNDLLNITKPSIMTTREIAELVEKRHDNVVRDTETMLDELQLSRLNFEGTYLDTQNKARKCYNLPRDLTMTLVTGYSIPLRKKVIDRLDELERVVAQPAVDPAALLNDTSVLRKLLLNNVEKVIALEAQVTADAPKVAFHDEFAEKDGLYTLQNAGRIITGRPNKFIQELKKQHLFYQGSALVPYVRYRQQGLFEVKIEPKGDHVWTQTFITPKGLRYFAMTLGRPVSALNDYLSGTH